MHKITKILLADRHSLVRIGIRTTLAPEKDLLLVGEAADIYEAQQLSKELKPNILLLALNTLYSIFPDTITDLRDTITSLCVSSPEMKVLLLTIFNDINMGDLIEAGAVGCVLKDEETETLVRAIRTVAQGDLWFSPAIVKKLAPSTTYSLNDIQEITLTKREQQILHMMAQGWDNVHIAAVLCLAEQTVRNYVSRIYTKLTVSSRAEAVVWAMKNSFSTGK